MRRHRITTAPPFDGKPTWHALYYDGKHWREVRNQQGGVIAYQTAVAAMIQAMPIRLTPTDTSARE